MKKCVQTSLILNIMEKIVLIVREKSIETKHYLLKGGLFCIFREDVYNQIQPFLLA